MDMVSKRWFYFNLARAYTWAGEPDSAFKQIEVFRGLASSYKVNNSRLDPVWDPIRKDPRFERMLKAEASDQRRRCEVKRAC